MDLNMTYQNFIPPLGLKCTLMRMDDEQLEV